MAQATTVEGLIAAVKVRLDEAGPVLLGGTFDIDSWALLCELVLPERFRAPPCDPEPMPAGDPEGRVLVMERRARHGYALTAPHDPPKPVGEDGRRGLTPAGGTLTPKQQAVRPAGHRRVFGRGGV